MSQILEGVKILEVANYAAAPMGGRLLADLGATVIHVENPTKADPQRDYQAKPEDKLKAGRGIASGVNYALELYGINKRSVTINLTHERGRAILYKMVETADVVLSNMRPYELKRYGLEYETLCEHNPKIILADLTGYGRKGPYKDSPGFDTVAYWSRTGMPRLLSAEGFVGAMGDNMTGLTLAFGIVCALLERERSGIGQEVDVSLFGTGVFQMAVPLSGALIERREQEAGSSASFNPLYGKYLTKDDRQFLLCCLQPDPYWPKVCRAVGRKDLIDNPQYNSFVARAEHCDELRAVLAETFRSRTLAEWKPLFLDIPSAPVQTPVEVINDEQARANDFFATLNHPVHGPIEVVATPIKFSRTPATVRSAAPEHGQNTEEVLLEYGYTWDDIVGFKDEGTI